MTSGNSAPPPDLWLYVSRRLDLAHVPNAPLWAVAVFTEGRSGGRPPVAFYRVTPAVLAWLERAGERLEAEVLAGREPRSQLDAYLDAMNVVWRFAGCAGVRVGAGGTAELPEYTGPK